MTAVIKEDIERIIDEYIKERLFNYDLIKEELRSIKSGEMIPLPADNRHAENMISNTQNINDPTMAAKLFQDKKLTNRIIRSVFFAFSSCPAA